jgi:hypothetical protein
MVKKILLGIAGVIIVAIILNIFIPITINIDKEINAVEIGFDDPNYCKPTTIRVKGELWFYLLGNDMFKGTISIDGYYTTQAGGVQAYSFGGKPWGFLKYKEAEEDIGFGLFTASTFLDKWTVNILNEDSKSGGSWNSIDGHCIIGPADTREEAIKVYNSLSSEPWQENSMIE